MKKIVLVLCAMVLFSGCTKNENTSSAVNTDVVMKENEFEIIDDSQYYRLKKGDRGFQYEILNESQNIVKLSGYYPKEPDISMLNGSIVKVSYQAGTGLSTKWTFYYDTENDKFSPVYYSVFDQFGENVVYRENDSIIVSDIFDNTQFYMVFDKFSFPIANSVDPFIQAKIDEDGKQIVISYLTGNDFEEITECFIISK